MADDLTNPLVRLITERMPWLFADHRFKIVDSSYDARSFGNCIVTLESEALRLRFTRDRGISFAELAAQSDPEYWFDVSVLLRPILGERPDASLEGTALLLKNNFPDLVQALGPKFAETKREDERRKEELLGRLAKPIPFKFSCSAGSNWFKQTVTGSVVCVALRLLEIGVVLWGLYTVFTRR
jgi:hypothetical protein